MSMSTTPRVKKSDATRASIMTAARSAFRDHGYDGASIRMIGSAANIDPAMVIRYFGNKESLFLEAVDIDLELPDLAAIAKTRRGEALVEHFVHRWEGEDDVLVTLLRSAVTIDLAAERLRTVYSQQVRRTVGAVVDRTELDRRSALVASEMLGVALTRYILRLPAIVRQSPRQIVQDHGPSVQRHLHAPLKTG